MDNEILPRIESTREGGIVLVDEGKGADFYAHRTDLIAEQEDANGLPESLTVLLYSLMPVSTDYDQMRRTLLRLVAEFGAANRSAGFLEGRKAEREENQR